MDRGAGGARKRRFVKLGGFREVKKTMGLGSQAPHPRDNPRRLLSHPPRLDRRTNKGYQ